MNAELVQPFCYLQFILLDYYKPKIFRKPSIRSNTTMPKLTILPFKKEVEIRSEETVMQALRKGGYEIAVQSIRRGQWLLWQMPQAGPGRATGDSSWSPPDLDPADGRLGSFLDSGCPPAATVDMPRMRGRSL